jgi:DNA primase
MPTRWIDFRALKAQVPIRDVLARYGFLEGLKDKGNGRLIGSCPIHGGKSGNSFHADTTKNVFNCFSGCGGGNVLDLVAKVEQCSVREAAEKLATWFDLHFDRVEGQRAPAMMSERQRSAVRQTAGTQDTRGSEGSSANTVSTEPAVNPPLPGPLKTLNHDHPYLWSRGLTIATVREFGIGFCTRGLMRNRVAIAIHNERSELVAYAGRAINEELTKEDGKYKLPAGFQKSHVVYNLNRAREHAESGLIVVEGFFDAMKVHQAGFPNVVGLMGSILSERQEELLLNATNRVILMFDGDEAGTKCLREFYSRLRRRIFLKEAHLEYGEQPDNLAVERLRALLA